MWTKLNIFSLAASTSLVAVINAQDNASNRAINVALMAKFNQIEDYGCWCHFAGNWQKGKGKPQDIYDHECRDFVRGYDCIYMDAEEDNHSCVPWETQYFEPMNIVYDDTDQRLIDDCTTPNSLFGSQAEKDCRVRTCLVESFFQRTLAQLEEANTPTNPALKLENGFNFDSVCAVAASGPLEKQCCGEYPTRFPFRPKGGDYKCCQNKKAYNSFMFECCDDGSVAMSC